MITNDVRPTREIQSRISMEKPAFNNRKTLFTSKFDWGISESRSEIPVKVSNVVLKQD
jgi:hypothetical protein